MEIQDDSVFDQINPLGIVNFGIEEEVEIKNSQEIEMSETKNDQRKEIVEEEYTFQGPTPQTKG